MSIVLTFSRTFPSYHLRKGEPTYFVEKIWNWLVNEDGYSLPIYHTQELPDLLNFCSGAIMNECGIKSHTIRVGNRWKVGMKFSPRIWSGKPYASKQIIIAPDIEVKKVWDIEILFEPNQIHIGIPNGKQQWLLLSLGDVAKNDGLTVHDFYNWFDTKQNRKQKIVKAQIICWSVNVNY